MLVCPVCKYHHQEEVGKCQRCNYSMQDNLEISGEHPILAICIPTLVKSLEDKTAQYEKLNSLIQNLDLQESDSRKLDEILDKLENQKFNNQKMDEVLNQVKTDKAQYIEEIENLKDYISMKFKSQIENNNMIIDRTEKRLVNFEDDYEQKNKVYTEIDDNSNNQFTESDRNVDNSFDLISNEQENGLYEKAGDGTISDREYSKNLNYQEDTEPEIDLNNNYQSFYRLIKNGELEVTKVTVPQETMEKMRGGTQSDLEFISDRNGKYWIVNWHDLYCLIPKEKINIEEHNYGNFQRVFDCQNYKETYRDFEVIKPATVFNGDGETWRLDKKGEIKFI